MKSINYSIKFSGILLGIVLGLFFYDNSWVEWIFLSTILVLVGIPHGAIDHIVSGANGSTQNLMKFFLKYLLIIVAYALLWYFAPKLSLLLFLLISAFHFGEPHFIHLKLRFKTTTYFITGAFWLSIILFSSFKETQKILLPILDITWIEPFKILIISSHTLLLLILILVQSIPKKPIILIEFLVLAAVLYYLPLIFSFALYFGFWHSLPTMMAEYKFLKAKSFSNFIKPFLPLTVVSIVGIGLILFFAHRHLEVAELTLLFFILISVITAPHVWVMHQFFARENNGI
jgi:Brp/Blh family beta-carotene 15,15'-monooxygenase